MIYPKKGDIVIIDAEPHSGKEYGGHDPKQGNNRRHMVVVSSDDYNKATGMILGMPITTSLRYENNPRYMPILKSGNVMDGVKGYIALWQLQNFDFKSRNGIIINSLTPKEYKQLVPYILDMLDLN
ncbi:type II toxin-antitoxin system PemK/MazF family toxin (plasmid) [Ligilactobacillus salivarius]|uniref:Type II toxin-antitoxin system PemK/MazF family toxin n=1 Tax=Ligilactobacillus salivarius TaxID=1624 RepID=A0ABD7YZL1_9LACO|nr:type II toxin-antitoxin system PemK/MazF family toxin [Ligilactobacillus salivarius]WHS05265.1 type II toxin-antitoxin system PemK/MazF family toxin [Ligilactobacillus salivarius]WHS07189.1 type II toxin-antitoxin system PemK/MazF family toxin [Ligilactobacillus salivarius]WHS10992.1 type II toxin-antitoxin system PemK/MazF family toxin [Ligilactobacillus salivarius]WHS15268.1 type II toxin-antitoxin system PemK/MazF family toxin [Ligilactobacillus salivarius]WHS18814.1 type II toxin-antito